MPEPAPALTPTAHRVALLLKRRGPLALEEIARALGVSKTAALRPLGALDSRGLVERSNVTHGRGRPRAHYRLTEGARRLFPQAYAEMTVAALDFVDREIGRPAVVRLLEQRTREVYERHRPRFAGKDLKARVAELAQIRDEGGYMAEVGATRRDGIEMLEFNCPILAVAERYGEACQAERALFERLLGAEVEVSHRVVAGDAVCRFLIHRQGTKMVRA